MTLDIRKYLENLLDKEATVSHFSVRVRAGKASRVKAAVADAIMQEYGEAFLKDADYLLFFTRSEGWTSKDVKKLFELADRALGQDANKLSKSDFMELPARSAAPELPDADGEDSSGDGEDSAAELPADAPVQTLFVKVTVK